jgi:hypothetical protein
MNTSFSNQGFESNSNIYTPGWSNHFDFSWQAHATRNYAPQFHDLHHSEYSQFNNPSSIPLSYDLSSLTIFARRLSMISTVVPSTNVYTTDNSIRPPNLTYVCPKVQITLLAALVTKTQINSPN